MEGTGPATGSTSTSGASAIITLNIGGQRYITTSGTLNRSGFFESLLSGRLPVLRDETGAYFIDRSGEEFAAVLHFLRTGEIDLSEPEKLLREARFYLIDELQRALETKLAEKGEKGTKKRPGPRTDGIYYTRTCTFVFRPNSTVEILQVASGYLQVYNSIDEKALRLHLPFFLGPERELPTVFFKDPPGFNSEPMLEDKLPSSTLLATWAGNVSEYSKMGTMQIGTYMTDGPYFRIMGIDLNGFRDLVGWFEGEKLIITFGAKNSVNQVRKLKFFAFPSVKRSGTTSEKEEHQGAEQEEDDLPLAADGAESARKDIKSRLGSLLYS